MVSVGVGLHVKQHSEWQSVEGGENTWKLPVMKILYRSLLSLL